MEPILRARLEAVPGCEGMASFLVSVGINSWGGWGRLTGQEWREKQLRFLRIRPEHPEDWDGSRLGSGHLASLDLLYSQAVQEGRQAAAEARQPPPVVVGTMPSLAENEPLQ